MGRSSWVVKSLQCKARAYDDVHHPKPKSLIHSGSCRHSLKDVIPTKPIINTTTSSTTQPVSHPRIRHSSLALTELPPGHPSRNVVEIIFHSGWTPKAFPGRVDVIFKLHSGARATARFHDYRHAVMARKENARCAADGNEVMGFHCLGPASCDGAWAFPGGEKEKAPICTYSGSGGAHESAGGGRGVRAMLVCRVVAGRAGLDSVGGDGGQLLVFDARAVLPCFLIIYTL